MPTSINGWPVLTPTDPKLVSRLVPGTTRKIRMRAEVIPLFLAFAAEYHKTIAPIDQGPVDDWGYAYRIARASSSWSDHSSGTALDLNASHEGAQGSANFSWWKALNRYIKVAALRRKYGVIQWGGSDQLGGEYHQPQNWDWMHWMIKPGTTVAQVQAQIKKLGIRPDGTVAAPVVVKPVAPTPVTPTPRPVPVPPKPAPKPVVKPVVSVSKVQPGARNSQVLLVQKALAAEGLFKGALDGAFGPVTKLGYTRWQVRCGYRGKAADGAPGLTSLTALGKRHGFMTPVQMFRDRELGLRVTDSKDEATPWPETSRIYRATRWSSTTC